MKDSACVFKAKTGLAALMATLVAPETLNLGA
jgi:hypothetical protein